MQNWKVNCNNQGRRILKCELKVPGDWMTVKVWFFYFFFLWVEVNKIWYTLVRSPVHHREFSNHRKRYEILADFKSESFKIVQCRSETETSSQLFSLFLLGHLKGIRPTPILTNAFSWLSPLSIVPVLLSHFLSDRPWREISPCNVAVVYECIIAVKDF